MTIELLREVDPAAAPSPDYLEMQVHGGLTREDYESFSLEVQRVIRKQGKARILFEMRDFYGWSAADLWNVLNCDLRHFDAIERVAIVGDRRAREAMVSFCQPFTSAQIRFFRMESRSTACRWLTGR